MFDRLGAVRPRTFLTGVLLTLAGAVLLFGVWPLPEVEAIGGGPVLDTRGFSAGSDAQTYLDALGAEGRRLYAIMLTGDVLWTVVNGLTVAAGIALGITRSRLDSRLVVLAVVPLAAMGLDLVENTAFLLGITAHPDAPPIPAAVMNVVTGTKLIAVVLGYLILAVALLAWFRRSRSGGPGGPHSSERGVAG
jgi:hypothetical protein